jgi:hypothetical protein
MSLTRLRALERGDDDRRDKVYPFSAVYVKFSEMASFLFKRIKMHPYEFS